MIIHPPVTVTTLHLSVLSYDLFLLLVFFLFLVLIFEAELNLQNTPQAAIGPFFSQPFLNLILILIAFITGNSSLEPLIEGLCAQIHVNLR